MDIQFNFGIKNGNFAGNFAGNIRGSITTIIGPSGSGKTTFLKCFSGDLKPTYGYIKIGSNILFSSDINTHAFHYNNIKIKNLILYEKI